jgi:flagellin-like hook-associated protein FlgL
MAISDITLGAGMRDNLASLQLTSALMARTTERLATGLKVNSAVDDPTAFFAAQAHRSRASDLAALKDAMGEAIQVVTAADEGITAITALIEQARGVAESARTADPADIAGLQTQFDDIMLQIDQLALDAGYRGTNLLEAASSLTVTFNEAGTSTLTITGFDASSTGLAISAADFTDATTINAAIGELDAALGTLRTNAQGMAANLGVVTTRQEFTAGMINTLQVGADQLTVADENEESANMLALQTRQQLAIATLGMASQAQQSILRLF